MQKRLIKKVLDEKGAELALISIKMAIKGYRIYIINAIIALLIVGEVWSVKGGIIFCISTGCMYYILCFAMEIHLTSKK